MKAQSGFSLVELLGVISIISIIIGISAVNFNEAREHSRDIDRQADLRQLQSAVELYKNKYGRYPAGCNGANNWSGQASADTYDCPNDNNEYIVGLAPEFIPALPVDPKLNGISSGYVYTVDAEGMVYKIMALDTVEGESVSVTHDFARCGDVRNSTNECASVPRRMTSSGSYNRGGTTPAVCSSLAEYSNDYALSGGYANGGQSGSRYYDTEIAREYVTDQIRCK